MSELTEDLAGLVDAIVRPLVEVEEELEVSAFETEGNVVMVEIRVNEDDAGKVIGRQGRVIKAVRTLARAAASRSGATAEVELID